MVKHFEDDGARSESSGAQTSEPGRPAEPRTEVLFDDCEDIILQGALPEDSSPFDMSTVGSWPITESVSGGPGITQGMVSKRLSPIERRLHTVPLLFLLLGTAVLACVAGTLMGIGVARVRIVAGPPPASASESDTGFTAVSNDIVVDVKGDVRKPGLVKVSSDARVQDVVDAAGGFVHEEDSVAINLAAPVDDGEEVVVPDVTKSQPSTAHAAPGSGTLGLQPGTSASKSSVVDINTADAVTLQSIPGIGPAKAEAIVLYRTQHGAFTSLEQLQKVDGIGPVTYQKIAPYVVIVSVRH